ncbi:MAG: hypothetical protein IPJ03_15770 [Ignavibacteriales bacterium]|nr:hypothetical protein [Ignavibacteriales bacterium]
MAKSKFAKTVKNVVEETPEEVKVDLAPPVETKPIITEQEETQTVTGVASAEKLQKGGWQLISCRLTPKGKEYKFRKVK